MKNQIKKSLSLLMAVLMILSCWVWVAPEKAEAAGMYVVKVVTYLGNPADSGSSTVTITYDGDGSPKEFSWSSVEGDSSKEGQTVPQEFLVRGFPTKIKFYIKDSATSDIDVSIKEIWINEVPIFQDSWGMDDGWAGLTSPSWEISQSTTAGSWNFANYWKSPYFKTLTEIKADKVAVNKYPSGADVTTKVSIVKGLDQYDVEYDGSAPTSGYTYKLYYMNNKGQKVYFSTDSSAMATIAAVSNKAEATVTLKKEIQTLFPDSRDGEIYVEAKFTKDGEESTTDAPLALTLPKYTATFYPNGGTIGKSKTDNVNASSETPYILKAGNMFYGSVIGAAPKYAEREGMELDGYYNYINQPSTGLEVKFHGDKFDPEATVVTDTGDSRWYAAWKAKTYKAYFKVGNNLLGTLDSKHGKAMLGEGMYASVEAINNMLSDTYRTLGKDAIAFEETTSFGTAPTLNGKTFIGWSVQDADGSLDDLSNRVITGDITFEAIFASKEEAAKEYNITFYDGNGNVAQGGKYPFRTVVSAPAVANRETDVKYSYEFAGWAKYVGKDYYAVDAEGKDDDGAYIPYIPDVNAEVVATEDSAYVPVFKMTYVPYTVTFNYRVTKGAGYATQAVQVENCHYGDKVTVPESVKTDYTFNGKRYEINGWKQGAKVVDIDEVTVVPNLTLTATYPNADAAPDAVYTINFYGLDVTDGEKYVQLNDGEGENKYTHKAEVVAPEVPATLETDDSLYTFTGWDPAVDSQAGADVDYKAIYERKDYADLAFVNADGTPIYDIVGKDNSQFVGDVIPEYQEEVYGIPERAEDEEATYEFIGWKDAAGNDVFPGSSVFTGDTVLTAQYEKTLKQYTVEFLMDDGKEVISSEKYEYREEIEIPENPTKDADDLYRYEFWRWEPTVSENCYGDATYKAVFRSIPIYYNVNWLNDAKQPYKISRVSFGKKIPMLAAPQTEILGDAGDGYEWSFKEWVRCDENGKDILDGDNKIVYDRNMTMPKEELYFYPTYEKVAGTHTVTFKDANDKLLTTKQIKYNEPISDYDDDVLELLYDEDYINALMAANNVNAAEEHYVFEKWVKADGSDLDTNDAGKYVITGDVEVKAVMKAEKHTLVQGEIEQAPTALKTGYAAVKCEFEYCTLEEDYVILERLDDNDAPKGQVLIGDEKWDSNSTNLYDSVIYVGANDKTVVNAEDLGTRTAQNPLGKYSRGVGRIDYAIVPLTVNNRGQVTAPDMSAFNPQTDISVWNNIYDYKDVVNKILVDVLNAREIEMDDYMLMGANDATKLSIDNEVEAIFATYKANATGILSELGLENGKQYVIYLRLSDIEIDGDVNVSYLSTGRLHYGTQPAAITLSGNGYGSKFCSEATVKITDDTDGFKVFINGTEQNISATSTSITGASATSFKVSEKGTYTITVVDKNGNKATKTFEVKDGHSLRNYSVAQTCEKDGSRYDLCTVCGYKTNEEVLAKFGHDFTSNYVDTAPTCVDNGYRTYTCGNNCGETYVEEPTADTLTHLLATKEHTFAKVQDAEGKDTADDAWVIDKAATCKDKGTKHKNCTVCGFRVDGEIAVDENAHKFFSARTTTPPTCTTPGEKTKKCKVCGDSVFAEAIPALGHTEGEYETTLEPTCDTAGSKVLKCKTCGTAIGEPVEIPALGCKYVAADPVKNEETGIWEQTFTCSACGKSYVEQLPEYVEPVTYTVTFKVDDADTAPEVITKKNGETIIATDVKKAPVKDADATYKYTFSHWATSTGEVAKFPIKVEADVTYYAVFAEKNIKYSITYFNEETVKTADGYNSNPAVFKQYDKVGYLNNGQEVDLISGPKKAEDNLATYKFLGWAIKGEKTITVTKVDDDGNEYTEEKIVPDYTLVGDKVTISGANVVLYAVFEKVAKEYKVTYAYNASETIKTYTVTAGASAPVMNNNIEGLVVEKEFNSKQHFNFKEWNKNGQLESVENNIYTTPVFEGVDHQYKLVKTDAATCSSNEKKTWKCSVCGYSYVEEISGSTLPHAWGEPVASEDGKNIVTCQRVGCGQTQEDTRKFTVKFYKDADATEEIKSINYVPWGTTVDAGRIPDGPAKAQTATTSYEFAGWAVKGTTTIVDVAKAVVKADVEYVPVYTETVREYVVTFGYSAKNVIKTIEGVKAGSTVVYDSDNNVIKVIYGDVVVAEYEGAPVPTKASDRNYHYSFDKWSASTADIQGDVKAYADFEKAEHNFVETPLASATCKNGAGTRYICECGYYYDVTGKPLEHNYVEVERKAATPEKDGYIKYECANVINGEKCGETKEEVLKYISTEISITVTVLHNNAPQSGVQVEIQAKGKDTPIFATTNANGIAKFVGSSEETGYTCWVVIDGEKQELALVKTADGNYVGTYSTEDAASEDCSCACHRTNFWGGIFRFFHKIIKMFTGEFKCCENPDPMYG